MADLFDLRDQPLSQIFEAKIVSLPKELLFLIEDYTGVGHRFFRLKIATRYRLRLTKFHKLISRRNFVHTLQVLVLKAIIQRQPLRGLMCRHLLKQISEERTGRVPLVYFPEVALVLMRQAFVIRVVQLCTAEGTQLRCQDE